MNTLTKVVNDVRIFSKAYLLGGLFFVVLLVVGFFVSFQQYQIVKSERNEKIDAEFEKAIHNFRQTLDLANTAIFTLALTLDEDGKPRNFEKVSAELIASHPFIDALELLPQGIIRYVYPYQGNVHAIGLDILNNLSTRKEALRALDEKRIYYAGPLELKQGGKAIIGRFPIFINDHFWGFASVILRFDQLLVKTGLNHNNVDFGYQISKINPNTLISEDFLPVEAGSVLSYQTKIDRGDWLLSIYDKDPNFAVRSVLPLMIVCLLLAATGATILKDWFKKPELLKRLLEQRSKELVKSEQKYMSLYEESPTMMLSVDIDTGLIENCNKTLLSVLGYKKSEVIDRHVTDFYHPDDIPVIREIFAEYPSTGVVKNQELRVLTKSGNIRHVILNSTGVKGANGDFKYSRSIWHDVTDQKINSEKLNYLQHKINAAVRIGQIGIWDWHLFNEHIYWSDKMFEIYDVDKETTIDYHLLKSRIHPDDFVTYKEEVNHRLETLDTSPFEYRIVWRNGEIRHVMIEMEVELSKAGVATKIQGIVRDITEAERIKERLITNERFLNTLITNLPGYSYRVKNDPDYTPEYISPGVKDVTGYSDHEYLNQRTISCGQEVFQDDKDWVWDAVQLAIQNREKYELTYRIKTKQGEIRWVWERGQGVWDEQGGLEALEGFVTEVTRQKQVEEKLFEMNQSLEEAEKMANIGNWQLNVGKKEGKWSKQLFRIFEMEPKDRIPTSDEYLVRVHPEDREIIQQEMAQLLNGQQQTESRVFRTNPDILPLKYLSANARIVFDRQGKTDLLIGTVSDITERMLADQVIRESEVKYRMLIEQASDSIITYSKEGQLLDCNRSFSYASGYSKEEIRRLTLNDLFAPKDAKKNRVQIKSIRAGKVTFMEVYLKCKDATIKDIELNTRIMSDGNVMSIGRDQTEKVKSQELIAKAQKEKEATLNRINDKVISLDSEWRYTFLNDVALEEHPLGRKEVIGKTIWEVHPGLSETSIGQSYIAAMESKEPVELKEYYAPYDTWFLVRIYPSDDGLTLFYQNINQQIVAERKIQSLIARNQQMIDTMLDGYLLADMAGNIIDVNPAYTKLLGYAREELLSKSLHEIIEGISKRELEERIMYMIEKKSITYETRHIRKDKVAIDLDISITIMSGLTDQQYIAAFVRDISDRKKSELQTLVAIESLELAEELVKLGSWRYAHGGKNGTWTKQMFRIFEFEISEKVPSVNECVKRVHPDDRVEFQLAMDQLKLGLLPESKIYRTNPELIELKYLSPSYDCIKDKNGNPVWYIGTILDVTERIVAENKIIKSEERFKNLTEMLPEAVFETDTLMNLTYANKRALEISGYTSNDLAKGLNGFDLIVQEDLERAYDMYAKRLSGEVGEIVEYTGVRKDGSIYPFLFHLNPIISNGQIAGFRGVLIDITNRKLTEKNMDRLAYVFEQSINEIYLFDIDTLRFTQVNTSAMNNIGYTMNEILKMTAVDLMPEFNFETYSELLLPLRNGEKKTLVFETIQQRKDQSTYEVEVHLQLLKGKGFSTFAAIILDISEKKAAERQLDNYRNDLEDLVIQRTRDFENEKTVAENLYRISIVLGSITELDELYNAILVVFKQLIPFNRATLFLLDNQSTKLVSNIGFRRRTPLLPKSIKLTNSQIRNFLDEHSEPFVFDSLNSFIKGIDAVDKADKGSSISVPLYFADRTVGFMVLDKFQKDFFNQDHARIAMAFAATAAMSLESVKLLKTSRDAKNNAEVALTQLRETQVQLVQKEKMASLGLLTAGIAHELNNPISAISINADSIDQEMADIFELLNRYNSLTSGSLDQSKLDQIELIRQDMEPEYVQALLKESLKDLKAGTKQIINIISGLRKFSRQESDEKMYANIHDGIEDTLALTKSLLKGKVTVLKEFDWNIGEINCYPGDLNQVFMNLIVNAEQSIENSGTITLQTFDQQDSVKIVISDDGKGMDEGTLSRIFEPFFTTKDVGEGTGLGLSITYGIVKKHGGTITVKSKLGQGTAFVILLPK